MESHPIDLTAKNLGTLVYVPVEGVDSISIETSFLIGTTFDSAVITAKRTNCINGSDRTNLNATPVTISDVGITTLDIDDWGSSRYIVLEVTTATTSARTIVWVKYHLKKFGFKLG